MGVEFPANLPGLLIVEDEKNTRDGLRRAFSDHFDVYLAPDIASAWNILQAESIEVVLCDIKLGGDNGMELLTRLRTLSKPPVCVMMTAYGSVETAIEAMRKGAYDYVTKPLNLDELEMALLRALKSKRVESENRHLKQALHQKFGLENLIGSTPVMRLVFDKIQQVANSRATVLIEGESGTGKELVAQALHQLSSRKENQFSAVHCAALSPQLLESELFGHEKGAFTGAIEKRIGRFEEANHGTIFLDEIGEIDAATQVKLLRVLGERVVQRVGSNQTIPVDVRVIAATNRNLEKLVEYGKFRDDLFFRLNVIRIVLPPLRERKEDIPLLVDSFIKTLSKENGKNVTGIAGDALQSLLQYHWPGNVRELRMAIEHGVVLAKGDKIGVQDLPERVFSSAPLSLKSTSSLMPESLNLEEMEKKFIILALRSCNGSKTEAAVKLGISRRTLHRKLNDYKIEDA
ncbi:MAG: sigma-54 dependent transcriptional regulator [Verrucomicrobiota bacterium]